MTDLLDLDRETERMMFLDDAHRNLQAWQAALSLARSHTKLCRRVHSDAVQMLLDLRDGGMPPAGPVYDLARSLSLNSRDAYTQAQALEHWTAYMLGGVRDAIRDACTDVEWEYLEGPADPG